VGGGRSVAAPGSAPKRAIGSPWEGGSGGVGGVGSPRELPRKPVGRGVSAPPGSARMGNKKHLFSCNALN